MKNILVVLVSLLAIMEGSLFGGNEKLLLSDDSIIVSSDTYTDNISDEIKTHFADISKSDAVCLLDITDVDTAGKPQTNTSIEIPALSNDFSPYGVWVIYDSILAYPQYAPQEKEAWPLDPICNGKRLVITENDFYFAEYDEFDDGEPDIISFTHIECDAITWEVLWGLRLSHEAEIWITDRMPYESYIVRFCNDDCHILPSRTIYDIDSDSVLYTDSYYFYLLERTDASER